MAVFESPDSKKCLSSTRVSHPYTGLLPQRGAGKLPMKGPRRQAPRRIPKCAILPGDSVQFEVGDDTEPGLVVHTQRGLVKLGVLLPAWRRGFSKQPRISPES